MENILSEALGAGGSLRDNWSKLNPHDLLFVAKLSKVEAVENLDITDVVVALLRWKEAVSDHVGRYGDLEIPETVMNYNYNLRYDVEVINKMLEEAMDIYEDVVGVEFDL